MALVAAQNLGASAEGLAAFFHRYSRRLRPRPGSAGGVSASSFSTTLGRPGAYGAFVDYFRREIDDRGTDEVVSQTVTRLRPGIHGAAYHGVLRLAYALERPTPARVASGLAYLAEVHRPLGDEQTHEGTLDPEEAFVLLHHRRGELAVEGATGLIADRMAEAASAPAFIEVVDSVVVDDGTFGRLQAIAAAIFAESLDFVALHGVTGLEAMRRVRHVVDDPRLIDREALRSLCAAYVVCGCPAIPETSGEAIAPSLDGLARAALASGDEHDLKIVDTAVKVAELPSGATVLDAARRYLDR